MITKDTYYIKRGDVYIWLAQGIEPLPTDEIIEVRPMLFADDGKILIKDGEEIGQAIWLKDGDTQYNYTEIDEPIEVEDDGYTEN